MLKLLKMTPHKMGQLQSIMKVLEETLRKEIPNCKAYSYGSTYSGFAFEDCDLDVFIDLGLCGMDQVAENCRSDQKYRTKVVASILR